MQETSHLIYELNVQSLSITTYTQYQNKLLLKLLACLQKDIKNAIDQQLKQDGRLEFTAQEVLTGTCHRQCLLTALEPRKGHYQRAKLALQQMAGKPIWIPYYKSKGLRDYVCCERLFNVGFYKKGGRIYVQFDFPTPVLRRYLSNAMGYHKLDLNVLFGFKLNSTRQMYRLYHSYFSLGHNKLRCGNLGWLLSCQAQFGNASSIKDKLLEPARQEMEEAFYDKRCKIHFDYTIHQDPAQQEGKQAGSKEKTQDKEKTDGKAEEETNSLQKTVTFTFYTAEDENLSPERKAYLETFQARMIFNLKNNWNVNADVAYNLGKRLQIWMIAEMEDLMARKQWFVDKLKRQNKPMRNPSGYIVTHLDRFFKEKEQHKKKIDQKGTKRAPGSGTDLFSGK